MEASTKNDWQKMSASLGEMERLEGTERFQIVLGLGPNVRESSPDLRGSFWIDQEIPADVRENFPVVQKTFPDDQELSLFDKKVFKDTTLWQKLAEINGREEDSSRSPPPQRQKPKPKNSKAPRLGDGGDAGVFGDKVLGRVRVHGFVVPEAAVSVSLQRP